MEQTNIHEGTPQELAPYLAQYPDRRFRLIEVGEDEAKVSTPSVFALDDKALAALSLLDSWIAEGKAADETAKLEAVEEVEEFKRNMNANRAATDERLIYP